MFFWIRARRRCSHRGQRAGANETIRDGLQCAQRRSALHAEHDGRGYDSEKADGHSLAPIHKSLRRCRGPARPLHLQLQDRLSGTALLTISLDPGVTSATIARAVSVTPQTMRAAIANLARDGFLRRHQDPHRGRVLRAELTEQGRGAVTRASAWARQVEAQMLAGFGGDEADVFRAMLERCLNKLAGR